METASKNLEELKKRSYFKLINAALDNNADVSYPSGPDSYTIIHVDDSHTFRIRIGRDKKTTDGYYITMWEIMFTAYDNIFNRYGEVKIEVECDDEELNKLLARLKRDYAEEEFSKLYSKLVKNN